MWTHLTVFHKLSKAEVGSFDLKASLSAKERAIYFPESSNRLNTNSIAYEESLEADCSRLAAEDNMSFKRIAESKVIRRWTKRDGKQTPYSPNTVKKIVVNFADRAKEEMRRAFEKAANEDDEKYTLCFDEWSSMRRDRYMNLSLSNGTKKFNLGLHLIDLSLPAKELKKFLGRILVDFGLTWKNIIAFSMDGCSVNVRLGKNSKSIITQLCFAHAIHLAVVKVLYNKLKDIAENAGEPTEEDDSDADESNENNEAVSDDEDDMESGAMGDFEDEEIDSVEEELHFEKADLIKKIRMTVKMIRLRRLSREALIRHVLADKISSYPLMVILDVKTRWNSLYAMLARFLLLIDPIKKALIDIGSNITFSSAEIESLREIVGVMKPITRVVEVLCSDQANLAIADSMFAVMFTEIGKYNSIFALELLQELKFRVAQRRTVASDVLQFLRDPKAKSPMAAFVSIKSQPTIEKYLKTYAETFGGTDEVAEEIPGSSDSDEHDDSMDEFDRQCRRILNSENNLNIMNSTPSPKDRSSGKSKKLMSAIDRELKEFKSTGRRGVILNRVLTNLLKISPTSVDSERAFSVAGLFVTKVRSLLSPRCIFSLTLLKSFFKNHNQIS